MTLSEFEGLGEPINFWRYFWKISQIPRCYIIEEAKKFGFEYKVDKIQNVVIKIVANPSLDDSKRVVLQCHMDMVCEKNENMDHDFSKDPLKLKIIEIQGKKWITAEGTTLGADNGVGIAYLLTIMKLIHEGKLKFDTLNLDLLFTVNEELGLKGAKEIEHHMIGGKYLINLDSEEDDKFTIGCAGGLTMKIEGDIDFKEIKNFGPNLIPIQISIQGLQGGHSGTDINKGRANAIKELTKIVWNLEKEFKIHVSSLKGGNLPNAIPREASAILHVEESDFENIKEKVRLIENNIKELYNGIEPDLVVDFKKLESHEIQECFSPDFQKKLLSFLYLVPNGPIHNHPTIKDLVHTSSNLASIKPVNNKIEIIISQRSLNEAEKHQIFEKVKALLEVIELKFDITIRGEYPSWPPDFRSTLVSIAKSTYKELFNEEVTIQAIHAGLECAILREHFPNIEMISIGPNVIDGHSPDERLEVQSVGKVWKFLIKLLKNLEKAN
ncbi:MAG: beta-Ala-His dipeptidase [Promethearchaeota archaeon]